MTVSLVVVIRAISHLGPEHRLRSGQPQVSLLGEAAAGQRACGAGVMPDKAGKGFRSAPAPACIINKGTCTVLLLGPVICFENLGHLPFSQPPVVSPFAIPF